MKASNVSALMRLFQSERLRDVDFDSANFRRLFDTQLGATTRACWTPLMVLCRFNPLLLVDCPQFVDALLPQFKCVQKAQGSVLDVFGVAFY